MNNKTKQLLDRVKSLEGDDTEPLLDSDDYGDDCEHTRMAEINGTTFCTYREYVYYFCEWLRCSPLCFVQVKIEQAKTRSQEEVDKYVKR